jgi:hypothetical protein
MVKGKNILQIVRFDNHSRSTIKKTDNPDAVNCILKQARPASGLELFKTRIDEFFEDDHRFVKIRVIYIFQILKTEGYQGS